MTGDVNKDSPIFYRSNRGAYRWFVYYYFRLTGLYLGGSVVGVLQPDRATTIASLLLIPNLIGLILLVALGRAGGKNPYQTVFSAVAQPGVPPSQTQVSVIIFLCPGYSR